jgi:Cu-processing system permease protein
MKNARGFGGPQGPPLKSLGQTPKSSVVALCARQELLLSARSRWTQIFAAVFGALSIAVAASGYILSGGRGFEDFARTATSLASLVILLVPITSLVIGVLSLAPERGATELLFSQPVSRRAILLGRLLGLFAALAAAQMIGLGAAGLVIFWRSGGSGISSYAFLLGASLALTAVFLGIAALLASGGGVRRSRALALALIVWFGTVVLFDVVVLAGATLLPSGQASRLLVTAVLVNPADAVRTATLLGIHGTAAFGAASLALLRYTRGPVGAALLLGASMLFWILAPVALAIRRLDRADF